MRIKHYDSITGLLILLIVYLHTTSVLVPDFKNTMWVMPIKVLSFFMPWFFFKSGTMYRRKNNRGHYVKIVAKSLLMPYVVFIALGFLYTISTNYALSNTFGIKSEISYYVTHLYGSSTMPLWFLPALFVCKVLWHLIENKIFTPPILPKSIKCTFAVKPLFTGVFVLVVSLSVSCIHFYNNDFNIPCYVGNISLSVFFYTLGKVLKGIQYNKVVFVISVIFYLFVLYEGSLLSFAANTLGMGDNYPLSLISGVAGCIMVNNLFLKIRLLNCNLFQYVGRNSMGFYLTHIFIIHISRDVLCYYVHSNNYIINFIITTLVLIITLPMIVRLLNSPKMQWAIGK